MSVDLLATAGEERIARITRDPLLCPCCGALSPTADPEQAEGA